MALTGDVDGPPLAVPTTAPRALDRLLDPFGLDADVLSERGALMGLRRGGSRSCGKASRLLRCRDGWVALTLARHDDVESLPAVFEVQPARLPTAGVGNDALWNAVGRLVADRPGVELVERGRLLGAPISMIGEGGKPFRAAQRRSNPRTSAAPAPLVVDMTSLWAGPLATSCLVRSGARVIKVEDVRRPDGARRGDPGFFDLLNSAKLSVALDLGDDNSRRWLRHLIGTADIVFTSSRQRAVRQLGLEPEEFLADDDHRVWVAITAHGWDDDRVGFGDDVAAAAGLVAWHPDGRPRFAGDAIADPIGGAMAADAALRAWEAGGAWFVDASLVGAAGAARPEGSAVPALRRDGDWVIDDTAVAAGTGRRPAGTAPALGADTDTVLGRTQ